MTKFLLLVILCSHVTPVELKYDRILAAGGGVGVGTKAFDGVVSNYNFSTFR
mgnify:CR=1 FL=1